MKKTMVKDDLFRQGDSKEIWQKYCGFLDLSLPEFMEIQQDLLLEQIEQVAETPIGKKIMAGKKPGSIAEFRQVVPLTTYEDYAEFLDTKREDVLTEKPYRWVHTSGRGGSFKWIPYTERAFRKTVDLLVAVLILATANKKGEVNLSSKARILHNLPPRPYFSAELATSLFQQFDFQSIPPMELANTMEFQEKIAKGFSMALRTGVDIIGSMSSVLVKIGEGFSSGLQKKKFSWSMLHPSVMFRFAKARLICKIQKRSLLPKDLWPVKGLFCSGTDATVYKDLVAYYWGKEPYQWYSSTDAGFSALQSWTKKSLTFTPFAHFIELIPEADWLKWRDDNTYQPKTVLLDEVKPGEVYEIVATHFYGMPLLRYRVGDLIRIVSLKDEETGINLPQMVFESRADGFVDIAGFARLDEKTVWQAITNTGIRHEDWCIRKEFNEGQPKLCLYIELKEDVAAERVQNALHDSLKNVNRFYKDLERMLEAHPVRATLLSTGTFGRYFNEKHAAGFDLAHLKPRHMDPSDAMVNDLIRLSKNS